LAPWEIYISESQERMLLTVPPEKLENVLEIFEKEDVEATALGKLTQETHLQLSYRDEIVADMNMRFLFEPPKSMKTAVYQTASFEEPSFPEPRDLTDALLQLLSSPNTASKESVVRTYDHEVKGNTVLKPLQGAYAGPNDAAVLKPLDDSWMGIAVSCGMNPNYGKIDTYWMAASAIDEAVRNNVAVGGRRIALLDNFTWGNPEKPERLGSLLRACEACYDFATAFKAPFISGKDSLYNESPLGPVTPTLLITALGIVPDIRATVSMDMKAPGNMLYIVGQTFKELGGSEYYKLKRHIGKTVPQVNAAKAKKTFKAITEAIDLGLVKACHDLSEGGLAVSAAEMALAGGYGVEFDLKKVPSKAMNRNDSVLFSESNSRFLMEVPEKTRGDFEAAMKDVVCAEIGRVTKNSRLIVNGLDGAISVDASLKDLRGSWKETLSKEA
jgi:phosphoribosylformylglycinamidine synthase